MYVCMYVCMYVYTYVCFLLFIKHVPLQRNYTTCFVVHLCYFFFVGDAMTNTINGFPLELSLLQTLNPKVYNI